MTFQFLQRLKSTCFILLAAATLLGQVDKNLVTSTDLLDVYSSGKIKPEVLTVFDFSGSMENTFWHRDYWTDQNSDFGYDIRYNSTSKVLKFVRNGGATVLNNIANATGFLVDPAGNAIAGAPTAALVKKASHARMTATMTDGSKTYTRTVDIPLPWTIFQVPSSLPVADGTLPVPDYVMDPASGTAITAPTTKVEFDTVYTLNSSNIYNTSTGQVGQFAYNADYLNWIFWGTVKKAADGNSFSTAAIAGYNDDRNQSAPSNLLASPVAGLSGYFPGGGGYVVPGAYDPAAAISGTPSTTVWNTGKTFANLLPAGTRCQFLKRAVLSTWFGTQGGALTQKSVLWAYRFLDPNGTEQSVSPKTTINTNNEVGGSTQRALTQFKSVSTGIHSSVSAIQTKSPANGTPLTYALANAYAQLVINDSGSSVFDANNAKDGKSPCRTTFVIVFTDGLANDSNGGGVVGTAEIAANALTAVNNESDIKAIGLSKLDPTTSSLSSSNFNIWSLAAVAAHGDDRAGQLTTGTGAVSSFAPFRVMSRGSSSTTPRKITTFTVGLSLAGSNTSDFSTGGKGPLLRTALYGDPEVKKFDLPNSVANDKGSLIDKGAHPDAIATGFYDAADPQGLTDSLISLFSRITRADTGITAPAAPLVGLNLGNRAYLGRFATGITDKNNVSSVWTGDLLMAGLGIQPDGTIGLKDNLGNFQIDINASNAVASASAALDPKKGGIGWLGRKVYTMIPGTTIPSGGLPLTDTGQAFSDQNGDLRNPKVMGTSSTAEAVSLIRFIRGAGKDAQTDGAAIAPYSTTKPDTRLDVMGDIINSSPAAVEYDASLMATVAFKGTYTGDTDIRYQVIFVGDNQGLFHAFGEKSGINSAGVLHGELIELWSFLPPEFLNDPSVATTIPKLSRLQAPGNAHIYTVDGSPYIYFDDSATGNRKVDSADKIRVIFGLRKGGRSYYALDVVDPLKPKLMWMVDPNNPNFDSTINPTIKTMGLATSVPSVARVDVGSPATKLDVVILGGGYSNNELDANAIGGNPSGTKYGRSLLVLDVLTGAPVKVFDFIKNPYLAPRFPSMGAIGAGASPLEFFVGSRKAQRVYFGDYSGGVYALGSMQKLTTPPFVDWRLDSSNIDEWTEDGTPENNTVIPAKPGVRWIYQGLKTVDGTGRLTKASPVTSVPAVYRIPKAIPQFRRPSTSTNAPNMIPPVVGVTFGTGDRNDPMDLGTTISPVSGNPYRQLMIFDRQDSADLPTTGGLPNSNVNINAGAITDAQLSDQTGTTIPGDTTYLGNNTYLGYFLTFSKTTDTTTLVTTYEKSYLNSLVINGGLIFSSFKPSTSAAASSTGCGGAGDTYTFRMCDALAPVFHNGGAATAGVNDKTDAGCNGFVFSWTNLAGDLTAIGSRMVLQSGQDTPTAAGTTSNIKIQDLIVQGGTNAFAPRAWRTVR